MRWRFVHIPKTGGVSVLTALGQPLVGHSRYTGDADFAFTFVREPYDRFRSAFRFMRRGGINSYDRRARYEICRAVTFADFVDRFVRDPHRIFQYLAFAPQSFWFLAEPDFVGRFERLNEDFAHVCKVIGVEAELPHLNASRGEIDDPPGAREAVRAAYAEDVERFAI